MHTTMVLKTSPEDISIFNATFDHYKSAFGQYKFDNSKFIIKTTFKNKDMERSKGASYFKVESKHVKKLQIQAFRYNGEHTTIRPDVVNRQGELVHQAWEGMVSPLSYRYKWSSSTIIRGKGNFKNLTQLCA